MKAEQFLGFEREV